MPPSPASAASAHSPATSASAEQSISGGARYMKALLRRYKGDRVLAAAAYNAGIGAVTFWAMNSARMPEPQGIGNPAVAPPPVAAAR